MTPQQEQSELMACYEALFAHMDEDDFMALVKIAGSHPQQAWLGWKTRADIAFKERVVIPPYPETESGNEGEPRETI